MNILAIGAHADDIELGCGGTLARHSAEGDNIIIYTATTSGGVNPFGNKIRDENESINQSKKAADILKAKLIIGTCKTNFVEFMDTLNAELIKVITENNIDIMYTHWLHDAHHDHRNLARASIHAGRHLNNILLYRSNWFQSDEPFNTNYYVDITDYWKKKKELLNCYENEMKRTDGEWILYNKNLAENFGFIIGTKYAEGFFCLKWKR